MAKIIAQGQSALYLDLEDAEDRVKLRDPKVFLSRYSDQLVVYGGEDEFPIGDNMTMLSVNHMLKLIESF